MTLAVWVVTLAVWVECCTPQERRSAMSARELWRPCSRRTRRSRGSTSDVRGSVLGGGGLGGDRVSLCWAVHLKASGPLAGRVAPLLVGVTLAVWVACCARRAVSGIGDDGARALAALLEKNTTLEELYLYSARLCARGCWERGDVARSQGRRPRAGARCRASSRVQLGGARAASGPLAGRVAPPLVGVTLAVWVGCCARRSQ